MDVGQADAGAEKVPEGDALSLRERGAVGEADVLALPLPVAAGVKDEALPADGDGAAERLPEALRGALALPSATEGEGDCEALAESGADAVALELAEALPPLGVPEADAALPSDAVGGAESVAAAGVAETLALAHCELLALPGSVPVGEAD